MVPYCVIFENDGLRKNAGIQLWLSAGVFGVKENPNPSPVENGFGSLLMVRVVIQHFLKTIVVQFVFEVIG